MNMTSHDDPTTEFAPAERAEPDMLQRQIDTVGCEDDAETVRFWVRNPRPMPRDVQLQVFQRSFSTKGRNRGIGTYSMKLLTERYLSGRVGFSSDPHAGTRFWAASPKRFPAS